MAGLISHPWFLGQKNRQQIHTSVFIFFSFSIVVGHFISLSSVCLTISYFQFSAINFRCYTLLLLFTIHSSRSTHFVFFALIWVFVFKSSDCCFLLLPNCYSLKKTKKNCYSLATKLLFKSRLLFSLASKLLFS